MIDLCCPSCRTGQGLRKEAQAWKCPECEAAYPAVGGVVSMVAGEPAAIAAGHRRKLAAALEHLEPLGIDKALERVQLSSDLDEISQDWRYYLPMGGETRTLLAGPQIGDLASRLVLHSPRLSVVCPVAEAARLVGARLSCADGSVDVIHLEGLPALPFPDRSFDVVVLMRLHEGFLQGPPAGSGTARLVFAEASRCLKPGGRIFLACESGALPARLALRMARAAGFEPVPEDRDASLALRGAGATRALAPLRLSPAHLATLLADAGLVDAKLYVPIPDPVRPKAVLPLDHRGAVAYFLDHLVRRTSRATRAAICVAKLSLSVGIFPQAVPFVYASAVRPGDPSDRDGTS